MSAWTNFIDRTAGGWQYATEKFRTPRRTPPYIRAELEGLGVVQTLDIFRGWDDEKRRQVAARIAWVYSNIQRIGNEVAAAKYNVVRKDDRTQDIPHPLEDLLQSPNEFFSGVTLLQYLIWGLSMDEYGAFWYLAPDSNTGKIREIWPIPVGTMQPIPHKEKFIDGYLYTPRSGGKAIKLPTKYVARFVYPNMNNIYKSLTPLEAAALTVDTYIAQQTTQRDIYKEGKGVPLAVLALDPNISEPDFAVARDTIRKDWADQNSIAIIRGGTLAVETLGLTSAQLQIIEAVEFTKDELDAAFMVGILWRRKGISGDERDEINKEIKEVVIHPLHMLIASYIQSQILERFFGKQWVGEFDDVRAQDRSVRIQEFTMQRSVLTYDQGSEFWGGVPFDDSELPEPLPGYGSLPLPLADNPSFVLKYYGLGETKDPEEADEEVGNLPEFLDPEALTNQMAEEPESVDLKAAAIAGMKVDLSNYKKVLKRTWRKRQSPSGLAELDFDTVTVFPEYMSEIKAALYDVSAESDIDAIFAKWLSL